MSGTHTYCLEVEIENPALRELLIKHKQAGAFDMIKEYEIGFYGHLLIAEAIDGVDYDFYFKDTSLSRNGAKWPFPQNVYQLLPYIVTIIAKTAYYPSEEKAAAFYAFRDDVIAHRDEIYRSYRYVNCWYHEADMDYGYDGFEEEKLFEIDREGQAVHKERHRTIVVDEECVSTDSTREEEIPVNYFLALEQSEEMRSLSQQEESEAALLLQSIEYELQRNDEHDDEPFHFSRVRGIRRDLTDFNSGKGVP